MKKALLMTINLLVVFQLAACSSAGPANAVATLPETAVSTAEPAATATILPTATLSPEESLAVWIDPSLPQALRDQIVLPTEIKTAASAEDANLQLTIATDSTGGVDWIYTLATPFSSLLENATFDQVQASWSGQAGLGGSLMVAEEDVPALELLLGPVDATQVEIVARADLLTAAWKKRDVFALVPFEDLEPKWKVVSLGDQSPVSNQFAADFYPLKLHIDWQGAAESLRAVQTLTDSGVIAPIASNRDQEKLTVVVMTGVTALVRATAVRMEEKGMTYPDQDILDWLKDADITHISNEISFSPDCPDPKMDPYPLIFCSKPEYMDLLDDVGVDVIDMTGNHQVDWGREALQYTFDMYDERGLAYYAAGVDVEAARDAVLIENKGNKFAFMGCNPAGPEYIWAAEDISGVANCDYDYITSRIQELKAQGYQVIFTFQYFETYRHWAEGFEETDFRRVADAGAVIVSGSQAHHPMEMEFYGDSFIHYGLGNLFFDQMWVDTVTIPEGTRKEFIDQHVFYDGKYISTGLLTAYLEDYSRPRPMSEAERQDFLTAIFTAADWGPYSTETTIGDVP